PPGTVILKPKTPWWRSRRAVLPAILLLLPTWTIFQEKSSLLGLIKTRLNHGESPVPQVAIRDSKSGTLVAKLPGRGTVELLAVSDSGAAPNEWWLPDGTANPDTLYELVQTGKMNLDGWTNKDFVLHWRDLPAGASGPQIEFEGSGGTSSGSELLCDGKRSTNHLPIRA